MRLLRILVLPFAVGCGGADDSSPAGSQESPGGAVGEGEGEEGGEGADGEGGEEDFGVPIHGAPAPPSLDALLDAQVPLASAEVGVGADGAVLELEDGLRAVVPAGAMPVGATLAVRSYAASGVPESQSVGVYRFEASDQPTAPVPVTFPLLGDVEPEAPEDVYSLWFRAGGEEHDPVRGAYDPVERTLTVDVTGFSTGVVVAQGAVAAPAATPDVVHRIPWYDQGRTNNCWSTMLTIFLNGWMVDQGGPVEIWDQNRFFGIDEEHGMSPRAFTYSESLANYIVANVRQTHGNTALVERGFWWTYNDDATARVRRYIDANLRAGWPVAAGLTDHMLVFVGVEGDRYVIHDPGEGAYLRLTWEEIAAENRPWLMRNGPTLLVLKAPLPPMPWKASLTVPFPTEGEFGGLRAVAPGASGSPPQPFTWYSPVTEREGFVDAQAGAPAPLNEDHRLALRVTVANIVDGSGDTDFDVGFEITTPSGATVRPESPKRVTLAGGERESVLLNRSYAGFRVGDHLQEDGGHLLNIYVAEGGVRYDDATIEFVYQPPPPEGTPVLELVSTKVHRWGEDTDHGALTGQMPNADGDIVGDCSLTAGLATLAKYEPYRDDDGQLIYSNFELSLGWTPPPPRLQYGQPFTVAFTGAGGVTAAGAQSSPGQGIWLRVDSGWDDRAAGPYNLPIGKAETDYPWVSIGGDGIYGANQTYTYSVPTPTQTEHRLTVDLQSPDECEGSVTYSWRAPAP